MQVKAIPVPVEARGSRFGGSTESLFLAASEDLAALTHRADPYTSWAVPGQLSIWLALPVCKDLLTAALMLEAGAGLAFECLAEMDADGVRDWAIYALSTHGAHAAHEEMDTPEFADRYRTLGADLARYFELAESRITAAFGLDSDQAPITVPSPRPAPTQPPRAELIPA